MKELRKFVLVGAPASGKGTQGRFLSETFQLQTLSTGALLRKEIELDTELGRRARDYMEQACLVPDEVVNGIVEHWLSQTSNVSWILDGYPRTVAQAENLDHFLQEKGQGIDVVVWMDVSRELIEHRILERRECSQCNYIVQDSSKTVCPVCGGAMIARKDDNINAFAKRWKDFETMTLPVARYYEERGLVVKISVSHEREVSEVSRELMAKLEAYAASHEI